MNSTMWLRDTGVLAKMRDDELSAPMPIPDPKTKVEDEPMSVEQLGIGIAIYSVGMLLSFLFFIGELCTMRRVKGVGKVQQQGRKANQEPEQEKNRCKSRQDIIMPPNMRQMTTLKPVAVVDTEIKPSRRDEKSKELCPKHGITVLCSPVSLVEGQHSPVLALRQNWPSTSSLNYDGTTWEANRVTQDSDVLGTPISFMEGQHSPVLALRQNWQSTPSLNYGGATLEANRATQDSDVLSSPWSSVELSFMGSPISSLEGQHRPVLDLMQNWPSTSSLNYGGATWEANRVAQDSDVLGSPVSFLEGQHSPVLALRQNSPSTLSLNYGGTTWEANKVTQDSVRDK